MSTLLIVGAAVFVVLMLLNLKTSRPDGTLIKKTQIHPYRTMLGHIMPTRNESVVYFDTYVNAEKLLEYIPIARQRFHVDVTHCLVGAHFAAADTNPKMNQFVVGRRLYQRNDWWVTFSMKRKKLDKEAKVAAVKMNLERGKTFEDLCNKINEKIGIER
ncbi:MAG: hypothetical protein V1754_10105, partial [Pseudomonadota bacterium]